MKATQTLDDIKCDREAPTRSRSRSTASTGEAIEAIAREVSRLKVLYGAEPSGLGAAFRRGFAAARTDAVVVTMDAARRAPGRVIRAPRLRVPAGILPLLDLHAEWLSGDGPPRARRALGGRRVPRASGVGCAPRPLRPRRRPRALELAAGARPHRAGDVSRLAGRVGAAPARRARSASGARSRRPFFVLSEAGRTPPPSRVSAWALASWWPDDLVHLARHAGADGETLEAAPGTYVLLPRDPDTPHAVLTRLRRCAVPKEPPSFVMLAAAIPTSDAILSRVSTCWQGSTMVVVKDGCGRTLVHGALTPTAPPFVHSVPGRLVEPPVGLLERKEARATNES